MIFLFSTRAGTAVLALLLSAVVVSRIVYPFDTGHLEAFSWIPTAHLLEGTNPYAYALTRPYSMVPYGIIYYALLGVGQTLFGSQMWFGRILSVIGCVICVWAVARVTRKLTESANAVWVTCLLCVALIPVQAWIGVMRSDLISIAFGLTAVSLVLTLREDQRIGAVAMAGVVLLAVAAIFTKHTTVLPAGIIVLRFLQLNRRRDAAIFSIAFFLLTSSAVFVLNLTSGGGYVWQHFIHAERLPFGFQGWWMSVFPMATAPTIIVFVAALASWVYARRKNSAVAVNRVRSPKVLVLFYLLLSVLSGLVSSGRVGSNVNYFLEASFVLAIVGGLMWNDLRQQGMRKIAAVMILLMVLGGTVQVVRQARGEYFRWQSLEYYREIKDTAAKYVRPGNVCASVYAELVIRNGCNLEFDDYGEYVGGWSPELTSIFEKEITNGRYAVIIWYTDNFAEKFPAYRLVPMSRPVPERFFPVYLYVRKSDAHGTPTE